MKHDYVADTGSTRTDYRVSAGERRRQELGDPDLPVHLLCPHCCGKGGAELDPLTPSSS